MTRSTPSRSRWPAFGLAALLVVAPTFASDTKGQARQRFMAAETAYNLGRFTEALGEYQRAYELSHKPELLFNMAQCQRKLERFADAAFLYERYLALSPKPVRNEANARDLLAEVRQRHAEQQVLKTPVRSVPRNVLTEPRVSGASTRQPEATPPLTSRWWFWTGIGVLVATGAGAYVLSRDTSAPSGTLETIDARQR